MARSSRRLDYLDEYSPGDVSELLGGSRFANFASLPNNFGDLLNRETPTYTSVAFNRLSSFKPDAEDKRSAFERFLTMQQNPDAFAQQSMQLPIGFIQAYGALS